MAFSIDPPFFDDEVSLYRDSMVRLQAESGVYYNISGTSALAALDAASIIGDFEYEISDEWIDSFGLFLSEVEGKGNEGYDGWQFWVNYPDEDIPMAAAENYELENGDIVDWYYGGYGINPDDSIMDIKIHIQIEEDTSYPSIDITIPKRGGIYLQGRELAVLPLSYAIVLGELNMKATASDAQTPIFKVTFFVDDVLRSNDFEVPYTYRLKGLGTGLHRIKADAYDGVQKNINEERTVLFLSN
jgi:hypothetical protein